MSLIDGMRAHGNPDTLYIPFKVDTEAPYALPLDDGMTLPVFEAMADCEAWITAFKPPVAVGVKALLPDHVAGMVDQYMEQIQWFVRVKPNEEIRGKKMETMPFWKLKMWAQYVQGDPAYKETLWLHQTAPSRRERRRTSSGRSNGSRRRSRRTGRS